MTQSQALRQALEEIARLGGEGMAPDYREWLTFHDKVAQIARAALSSSPAAEEDGWRRGFPEKSGMYLVYLSDGEQVVTYWNDGRGKNADTWGDERPHGWGAIRDWSGRVKAWRPLPSPPASTPSPETATDGCRIRPGPRIRLGAVFRPWCRRGALWPGAGEPVTSRQGSLTLPHPRRQKVRPVRDPPPPETQKGPEARRPRPFTRPMKSVRCYAERRPWPLYPLTLVASTCRASALTCNNLSSLTVQMICLPSDTITSSAGPFTPPRLR